MIRVRTLEFLDSCLERPGLPDHAGIRSSMNVLSDVFNASRQLVQTMIDIVEVFFVVMVIVVMVIIIVVMVILIVVMVTMVVMVIAQCDSGQR